MIGSNLRIYLSLFLAMIFSIAPMPDLLQAFRPDWLLLALFYWSIALPHKVNIGTAFIFGLLLDILMGAVLGVNALILSFIAYIAAVNYLTIRNFSMWQQALIVALLSSLYKLSHYWIEHFLTTASFFPELMWPIVVNTLIWPWIFLLFRKYRRKLRIR